MLGHVATSIGRALPGSSQEVVPYFLDIPAYTVPGTYTYVIPESGMMEVFGIGAGASGPMNGGGQGGGAGSAGRKLPFFVVKGETLTITIGTPGPASSTSIGYSATPTTIVFPNGTSAVCGGGGSPTGGSFTLGGVATGWDVNSNGGNGGLGNFSTAQPGSAGANNGGLGGAAAPSAGSGAVSGGGGAGGFGAGSFAVTPGNGTNGRGNAAQAAGAVGYGSGTGAVGTGGPSQAGGPAVIKPILQVGGKPA